MASNPPAFSQCCHDGHNEREANETRNQRQVDATLAENGFAVESLFSQYTYRTIGNHALRVPFRDSNKNAQKRTAKRMSRTMCKRLAPWLNEAALNLYVELSNRADIRRDMLENANTSGFQEGYAPYVLYHVREKDKQGPEKDEGAKDKIPLEYWQICPHRHMERIEGHNMIENRGWNGIGARSAHHLDIQRSISIEDRRLGYFVVNSGLVDLRINGEPVVHNCIAGPLPRFSIIQHGGKAFFFFRDADTLITSEGATNATTRLQSSKRKSPLDDGVDEPRVVKKRKVAQEPLQKLKGHSAPCRRRGRRSKNTTPKAALANAVPIDNQLSHTSQPAPIIEKDTTDPFHTSQPAHATQGESAVAPAPSSQHVSPSNAEPHSQQVQSGLPTQPSSLAQPDASAQTSPLTQPAPSTQPAPPTQSAPSTQPAPSAQPAPPNQPVPPNQPAPSTQPAPPTQPAPSAQSAPPNQPAPPTHPAPSVQSTPPNQPVPPTHSAPSAQPVANLPVPFTTWAKAHQAGVTRCRSRRPERSMYDQTAEEPHVILDKDLIEADVVDRAIASMWIALRERISHDFAFIASMDSLTMQLEMARGMVSIGTSDTLIMPILLQSEIIDLLDGEEVGTEQPTPIAELLPRNWQQMMLDPKSTLAKTKIKESKASASATAVSSDNTTQAKYKADVGLRNHFILAVARRSSRSSRIRMEFYDSRPGTVHNDLIRRIARNIVRNSAWLGNRWPTFGDASNESWINVQEQENPTCGYHVIFNAWAVMLNIDVRLDEIRYDDESFNIHARRITNLAVEGRLDTETIVAFMHNTGLASSESVRHWYQETARTMPGAGTASHGLRSFVVAGEFNGYIASSMREARLDEFQNSGSSDESDSDDVSHRDDDSDSDDDSHPGDNDGDGGDGGDGNDDDDQDGDGGGDEGGGDKNGEDEVPDDIFSGWLPIDGPNTDQAVTEGEKSPSQKGMDTTPAATGKPDDGQTAKSQSSGPPGPTTTAPHNDNIPGLSTEQQSHQEKGKDPAPSPALLKKIYIKKQLEQRLSADMKKSNDKDTESTSNNCAQITNLANLTGQDILMAITSLWRALLGHEQGTEPCSSPSKPIFSLPIGIGRRAVGRTRRLLFPLSLTTRGKGGQLGTPHYVLCLAVFDGEDEVLIEYYDSSITPTSQATSQEKAEHYVKNAEWLSISERASRAWPRVRHSHLLVPQMARPGSSGLLVILNAWMLLLRLSPRVGSSPDNGFQTSDHFLQQGHTLINRALAGGLQASTIQAFLYHWGLTEDVTGSNFSRVRVTPVRTIRMRSEILEQIGKHQKALDAHPRHVSENTKKGSEHSSNQVHSSPDIAIANNGGAPNDVSTTSHVSQHDKDRQANLFYQAAIEEGLLNASDAEDSVRSDRSSEDSPMPDSGKETSENISTTNINQPQNDESNAGLRSFHEAAIEAGDPFESIETDNSHIAPMTDPIVQTPPQQHGVLDMRISPELENFAQNLEDIGDYEGAERIRKMKWKQEKYRRHPLEF